VRGIAEREKILLSVFDPIKEDSMSRRRKISVYLKRRNKIILLKGGGKKTKCNCMNVSGKKSKRLKKGRPDKRFEPSK